MKRFLAVVLAVLMIIPGAFAANDYSGISDDELESLLGLAEFFAPMTQEEIRALIVEIKAELESRKAAAETDEEDEEDETVIFSPGKEQFLVIIPSFFIKLTGEYKDEEIYNGRQLVLSVILENPSEYTEVGLILDKIIVNGWETTVSVPLYATLGKKGKKREILRIRYTEAGIKSISEIESVTIKAHVYGEHYTEIDNMEAVMKFNWSGE